MRKREEGFVLITSLVILLLLTILGVGLYYRSAVNQQVSASTRDTTKAYYFAETALDYVSWSLFKDPDNADTTVAGYSHDLELDGFNPTSPSNASSVGDRSELAAKVDAPATQLKYFDNANLVNYDITAITASQPNPYGNASHAPPTLSTLSLTKFLGLAIDTAGAVTVSAGTEPANGAVLWLTAAGANTPGIDTTVATGDEEYQLVAYAIGIVNGRRLRMLRAIVGKVGPASENSGPIMDPKL